MIDYLSRRNEFTQSKDFMLSKLETDEARLYFRSAYYEYLNLALTDLFLETDIRIAKRWFYKAARIQELQYRIGKGEYKVTVKLDRPKLSTAITLGCVWAVLSDSQALTRNFAEAMVPSEKYDEDTTSFGYYLAWSVKQLLLGEFEEAYDFILKAQRKRPPTYQGYAWVIQGILEKEPACVQKGLDMQLALHRKIVLAPY